MQCRTSLFCPGVAICNTPSTLSVIEANWKYILSGEGPGCTNPWVNIELGNDTVPQLYDLKADRGEKVNVAANHPDLVRKLSEKLESIRATSR